MSTIREETVELSPSGSAPLLASELLAIAAATDNPYRVDDVRTTSSGPRGLAFLVPVGLYELWDATVRTPAAEAKAEEKAAVEQAKNKGGRRRAAAPAAPAGAEKTDEAAAEVTEEEVADA